MEKAFDLADLGKKEVAALKAVAVPATGILLDWVAESCALVQSPIVKGIGAVIAGVKPVVLEEVAKAVK